MQKILDAIMKIFGVMVTGARGLCSPARHYIEARRETQEVKIILMLMLVFLVVTPCGQYVSPKRCYPTYKSTRRYNRKTNIDIVTAVRTSNLI
jgi:hypothetical protein